MTSTKLDSIRLDFSLKIISLNYLSFIVIIIGGIKEGKEGRRGIREKDKENGTFFEAL